MCFLILVRDIRMFHFISDLYMLLYIDVCVRMHVITTGWEGVHSFIAFTGPPSASWAQFIR